MISLIIIIIISDAGRGGSSSLPIWWFVRRKKPKTGQPRESETVRRALEYHAPPLFKNRRPKVYYATQVASAPPTIVLVCNNPTAFAPDYRRYLLSFLREELPFDEVPIKLYLNKRTSSDKRDEVNDGS